MKPANQNSESLPRLLLLFVTVTVAFVAFVQRLIGLCSIAETESTFDNNLR